MRLPIVFWLVLVCFYSIIAFHVADWPVFSSPDETANFAFANRYKETSTLQIPTDLSIGSPRSVRNLDESLTPISFVFFPAFLGGIGKFCGVIGILLFGPFMAATAVLCFWSLCKKLFSHSTLALWAAGLFATAPTFWFYASRGLWQNGVFLSTLLVTIWLTVLAWQKRWWGLSILAGLAWGVTIAIRPSEAVWLIPGAIVSLAFLWRKIPWQQTGILVASAILPLLCFVALQGTTYGQTLASGYRQDSLLAPAPEFQDANILRRWKSTFFPFGTSVRIAAERFATNGTEPIAYILIPGCIGMLWLLVQRRMPLPKRAILIGSTAGAILLILLYGNFRFVEYPVSRVPTLGSSYLRYWLPLIPLISIGIAALLQLVQKYARKGLLLGWIFTVSLSTISLCIVWTSDIGIAKTFPRFSDWQAQSRWIVENTPVNAIILAVNNDKLAFPHRQTVGYNGSVPPGVEMMLHDVQNPIFVLLENQRQEKSLTSWFPDHRALQTKIGPHGATLVELTQ